MWSDLEDDSDDSEDYTDYFWEDECFWDVVQIKQVSPPHLLYRY